MVSWATAAAEGHVWIKALLQPRSELMSTAPDTMKGHAHDTGLSCHLGAMLMPEDHVATGTMPILVACNATWGRVDI